MKLKARNVTFLIKTLKEIQQQIISFDRSLKTMWHGRDAKSLCFLHFEFADS